MESTLLISPILRGLYTNYFYDPNDDGHGGICHPNINAVLNIIPQTGSALRHLELAQFLPPHCLSTISKMRHLRTLSLRHCVDGEEHCTSIPSTRLIDLLSLPNLHDLKLLGNIILCPHDNSPRSLVELSSVKKIYLELFSDLADIEGLFRQARFPMLEELTLYLSATSSPSRADAKYWPPLCSSLLNSTTSNLHHLKISAGGITGSRQWAGLQLTLEDLSGLFKLDLIDFDTTSILHSISENDIVKLTGSWRRLQRLVLQTCQSPQLDFAALVVIASNLPCLRDLSIEVDARELAASTVPILKHRLHVLCLFRSPLKEPIVLAQSLDRIFPYLNELLLWTSGSKASEVRPILRALQQARKEHEMRLDCVSDVAFNRDEAQD